MEIGSTYHSVLVDDSQDEAVLERDQKLRDIGTVLFGSFLMAGWLGVPPVLHSDCRIEVSDAALYRHPNTAHCFYNKGTLGWVQLALAC